MKTAVQRGVADRSGHDPRAAALRIVDKVLSGSEASQAVLNKILRDSNMVPSDKGLCTELVYGYLRWSIRLDWDLARYLKMPDKLPGEMLLVLGLAAYELAFLSRIPAHASVNWAVNRIRNRFGQGLAGVANSVLRRLAREAGTNERPDRYDEIADPVVRFSVVYSLPEWIVRLWLEAYGEEKTIAFMRASSEQAVSAVRVSAIRDGAVGLCGSLVNDYAGIRVDEFGVAFPHGVPYVARELEREGRLSFQSPAVQELQKEMGMPGWKGPVWDACAGRGGKTAAMIERGICVKVATDTNARRIAALPAELKRLGFADDSLPLVLEADACNPPLLEPVSDKFATIVADVPCSGLGTLSRRPEIRFRRTAEDVAGLIVSQDAVLDSATRFLVDGGRIVYLTCTLNPAENEERVRAFLVRHQDFSLEGEWTSSTASPWHEFLYGATLRQGSNVL